MKRRIILLSFGALSLSACFAQREAPATPGAPPGPAAPASSAAPAAADPSVPPGETFRAPAGIPAEMVRALNEGRESFVPALERAIAADAGGFLVLVDKGHLLSADYAPSDLVPVGPGRSYVPGREGLSLRREAEAALERMAGAARADGVTLVVSSTYRSWEYQKKVYERNVRELGRETADRESAMPGASQHQLGAAVDFGSITDAFAGTKAGKWLVENAYKYGWSLSFPDGYEAVTGFRWESWHYRYVGVEAAALQRDWFGDVQQYMIEFVDAWKRR